MINDVLKDILVTGIVSGIIVFTLQQWIKGKFREIDSTLSQQRLYQQKGYELLIASYKSVWKGLVEIERFNKYHLIKEIQKASVDPDQWPIFRKTYMDLRGEMLFLPEELYDDTSDLLGELEGNINTLLAILREFLAAKNSGGDLDEGLWLSKINGQLDKINDVYSGGLEKLKKRYQAISRDVLLKPLSGNDLTTQ